MAILTAIDRAIMRTVIYFDLFSFPLTADEIYSSLLIKEPVRYSIFLQSLNHHLPLAQHGGFYFLPGREELVAKRKQAYLLADDKFKIARKNAQLLRRLPFVRAIFVANRLAYSNASDSSDIDFVIVSAPGRIWTCRFFTSLLLKILNRRPTDTDHRNKICLSFYLEEPHLNVEKYFSKDDHHFCFWINQFFPLYDPDGFISKVWQANRWSRHSLPHLQPMIASQCRAITAKSILQNIFEFFLTKKLEFGLKKIQLKIMPAALTSQAGSRGANVILKDELLKLHYHDRRQEYNELFEKRGKKLILGPTPEDMAKLLTKIIL
jgi:hypothetical protein